MGHLLACGHTVTNSYVTGGALARQLIGSTHLPRRIQRPGRRFMMPQEDAGDLLDAHWAVAVFEPADRKELLAFAEQVRRQLVAGTWAADAGVPEQLLPLSSAYELAARERLDLFGLGHPNSPATIEQRAERARFVEL